MAESKQISNINTLRGLAALSVCMFHTSNSGMFHAAKLLDVFAPFFKFGYLGVQVFFVISGFIIPYSLYKSKYSVNIFPRFILKRYIRIAPTAWVSIMLMICFYWVPVLLFNKHMNVFDPEMYNLKNIPYNMAFIAPFFGIKWIILALWTLNIEFQYYFFIGILFPVIMSKKTISFLLILLFSLSGFAFKFFTGEQYNGEAAYANLLIYHAPLFSMGIVTFLYKIERISIAEYVISIIAFLIIGIISMNHSIEIVVGLFSSLFIIFVHHSNRVTDFFGKISYSLYLNHVLFATYIDLICRQLIPQTDNIPLNFILIVSYYSTIFFASWVFYYYVERYFHIIAQKMK